MYYLSKGGGRDEEREEQTVKEYKSREEEVNMMEGWCRRVAGKMKGE